MKPSRRRFDSRHKNADDNREGTGQGPRASSTVSALSRISDEARTVQAAVSGADDELARTIRRGHMRRAENMLA